MNHRKVKLIHKYFWEQARPIMIVFGLISPFILFVSLKATIFIFIAGVIALCLAIGGCFLEAFYYAGQTIEKENNETINILKGNL